MTGGCSDVGLLEKLLEAVTPPHHPPPAGGTDLRYQVQTNLRHSTLSYRHSGPAGPAEEVTLSALVDLGVPAEPDQADLESNLGKNERVSLQIVSPDTPAS